MLLQFITRMNADYTVTNHYRKLDDMHYRPLKQYNLHGALSDAELHDSLGYQFMILKQGTTSQGYVRLLYIPYGNTP